MATSAAPPFEGSDTAATTLLAYGGTVGTVNAGAKTFTFSPATFQNSSCGRTP